jgi:hypothetical protein
MVDVMDGPHFGAVFSMRWVHEMGVEMEIYAD